MKKCPFDKACELLPFIPHMDSIIAVKKCMEMCYNRKIKKWLISSISSLKYTRRWNHIAYHVTKTDNNRDPDPASKNSPAYFIGNSEYLASDLADLGPCLESQSQIDNCSHENEEADEDCCFPWGLVRISLEPQFSLHSQATADKCAGSRGCTAGMLGVIGSAEVQSAALVMDLHIE